MAELFGRRSEQQVLLAVAAAVGLLAGGVVVLRAFTTVPLTISGYHPSSAAQESRAVDGLVFAILLALALAGLVVLLRHWAVLVVATIAFVVGVVLIDRWVVREERFFIAEEPTYAEAEATLPGVVESAVRAASPFGELVVEYAEIDESASNRCSTSHGSDTGSARLWFRATAVGIAPGMRDAVSAELVDEGFAVVDLFTSTGEDLRQTTVRVSQGALPGDEGDLTVTLTTPCLRDP